MVSSKSNEPVVAEIPLEETFSLRISVLRPHLRGDELRFPGDDRPNTIHLGAFLDDVLVGVTTAIREPPPDGGGDDSWRLRGVAVDPEHQGSGVGWTLMLDCERRIRAAGGEMVWCNARTGVIPFYEKLGFEVFSDVFNIAMIGPHVEMRKLLLPMRS
jgi:GNAT superfamily N-acetyltransferase